MGVLVPYNIAAISILRYPSIFNIFWYVFDPVAQLEDFLRGFQEISKYRDVVHIYRVSPYNLKIL